MILNKKIVAGLVIFLAVGLGQNVFAQFGCDNDGICEPGLAPGGNGEDSILCPADCAGLCAPCIVSADCEAGLNCEDGKCRGCPCAAGEICFCNPLKACGFDELIDKIVDYLFYIVIAAAPIMFVLAGFYFTTAAGDAKRITTAKTIVIWTLVGLFITLMAKGIIGVIRALLG